MINTNDSLKIIKNSNISIEDIDVLMNLYKPVIGIDTIKVYLSLYYTEDNLNALTEYLKENDLDCYEFNRYKQALEEVELIETFESVNESDLYKFIISINKPKGYKMLKNELFLNKLKSRVNDEKYLILFNSYSKNSDIPDSYKNVSSLTKNINKRVEVELNNYSEPKSQIYTKSVVYDIKSLLSDNNIRNSALYPLITAPSNLAEITRILEIAGISSETFRSKVLINFIGESVIDFEKMRSLCFNCRETLNYDTAKGYLNPCSVFLKKLYGFEPEYYDKKLADMIYQKYNFSVDVINYLFEYCLNTSDKKINTNYLSRICTTVKLKNITSIDAIKKHLNAKKGVEFKREEENEIKRADIDKKALDAELQDILNRR